MRKRMIWWAAVGLLVVLVVGVTGFLVARRRDSVSAVSVDSAVDEFRAVGTGPAPPELPAPGVYLYETVGEEHVDVLGGLTHHYPARTTVTVTPRGCGVVARWTGLAERWDERVTCADPNGEALRRVRQHHEFFGHVDERAYRCVGMTVRPVDPEFGDRWSGRCANDDERIAIDARVVGFEDLTVGGQRVATVHIREVSRISGRSEGTHTEDDWLRLDTGLLVRRTSAVDSELPSPIGTAHYREELELRLVDLRPRR